MIQTETEYNQST